MYSLSRNQIQNLRCIAILLVLIHHTLSNLEIDSVGGLNLLLSLSKADVVFFFIISGFLFEMNHEKYLQSRRLFLINKVRTLVVPYLFWTLLLYIAGYLVHHVIGGSVSSMLTSMGYPSYSLIEIIRNTVLFTEYYVEHLWFLYVLFVIFVISILLDKICGQCMRPWVLFILICVFICLQYYVSIPFIGRKFLMFIPDFFVGRMLFQMSIKQPHSNLKKEKIVLFAILCVVGVVASLLLYNVFQTHMDKTIVRSLLSQWCTKFQYWFEFGAAICLVSTIEKTRLNRITRLIGDHSFEIYLMHTPYVVPLVTKGLLHFGINKILIIFIAVICGVTIPMLLTKLIFSKFSLTRRIMLGKRD